MAKSNKTNWRKLAKDRGRRFEGKVAKLLPGAYVYVGIDGDVRFEDYGIECKYRKNLNLRKTDELEDWFCQIERYKVDHWPPDMKWALVFTGGKQVMHKRLSKSGTFVTISIEHFIELTTKENNK